MEAIAEAKSVGVAEFGDVRRGGVEFGGGAAFGHEQDACGGNGELVLQREHFVEIGLGGDDEFEPCLG